MSANTEAPPSTPPTAPPTSGSGGIVRWILFLGPPLALMAAIYWLGSDRGSLSETGSLLRTVLTYCWPGGPDSLTPETLHRINVVFRKSGHFFGYALLALLWTRALCGLRGSLRFRLALVVWVITTAWAAVDEYHQSFAASRGSTAADVVLDACGAIAGILLYGVFWRWRRQSGTMP